MYIVPLAWLYVTLMMAVAEATSSTGTVLGAIITFVLYGALPITLVVYVMAAPRRARAIKAREQAQWAAQNAAAHPPSDAAAPGKPDADGETAAAAVPAVRKEP